MKLKELKSIVKTAVKEAIQEELDKMAGASDRLEMLETYFEDDPYGILE